jgi:hypothetical protein
VTAVGEGRPSSHKDVGKKLTLKTPEGNTLTEPSDLVLWTAGLPQPWFRSGGAGQRRKSDWRFRDRGVVLT